MGSGLNGRMQGKRAVGEYIQDKDRCFGPSRSIYELLYEFIKPDYPKSKVHK